MASWLRALLIAAFLLNVAQARKQPASRLESAHGRFLNQWKDNDQKKGGMPFGPYKIANVPDGLKCSQEKRAGAADLLDIMICSNVGFLTYSAMLGSLAEGSLEAYERLRFDQSQWDAFENNILAKQKSIRHYECRHKFVKNASRIPMNIDICFRRLGDDWALSDALITARIMSRGYRPLSAHLMLAGVNNSVLPDYVEFFVDSIRPGGGL